LPPFVNLFSPRLAGIAVPAIGFVFGGPNFTPQKFDSVGGFCIRGVGQFLPGCYSFLVYVSFAAVRGRFPITVSAVGSVQRYVLELHVWPLIEPTIIAGLLAVLVAAMMNRDFPLSVLRRLRITQWTSRVAVWNDCFDTFGDYVQVELADGRQVMGWLRFYSNTEEESALFLEDAAWIGEGGVQIPINGPGILLTKRSGIRTVMFLSADEGHASLDALAPSSRSKLTTPPV
jgi:hypothetical protein